MAAKIMSDVDPSVTLVAKEIRTFRLGDFGNVFGRSVRAVRRGRSADRGRTGITVGVSDIRTKIGGLYDGQLGQSTAKESRIGS